MPYLRAPAQAAQRWINGTLVAKIEASRSAWSGPAIPSTSTTTAARSISDQLAPLFAVPGASFASLQVGARRPISRRLKRGNSGIADLAPDFGGFCRYRRGRRRARSRHHGRYFGRASCRRARQAGLGAAALGDRLALDAATRGQSLVSDHAAVPPDSAASDWSDVIARVARRAEGRRARRPDAPDAVQGRRRAPRRAGRRDHGGGSRARDCAAGRAASRPCRPARRCILAEQKRRHGFWPTPTNSRRRAAAARPDNAEAVHMLGIIAHQSGKLDRGDRAVRRAIAIKPDVALYHANLGEMCRLAGRVDEAIAAGRRALELNPDYAGAHSNLGIALFDQGKFEEALAHLRPRHRARSRISPRRTAIAATRCSGSSALPMRTQAYRRAIELQPTFADAWNNLGTCLRELKRPEEAETRLSQGARARSRQSRHARQSGARAQGSANGSTRRQSCCAARWSSSRAATSFTCITPPSCSIRTRSTRPRPRSSARCALNPNNHDAVNLMGRVAFERGDLEAALAHYRRALALKPDLADAYNNMGNVLKELGQLRRGARRLSGGAAPRSEHHRRLRQSRRFEEIRARRSASGRDGGTRGEGRRSVEDRPHAARFRARQGLRRSQGSRALVRASARRQCRPSAPRSPTTNTPPSRCSIASQRSFTRELIAAKPAAAIRRPMPIFVIGMPRSGTTLVEQILASHPAVHGAGELQTFNDVVLTVRGPDGNALPYPEFVPALDAPALQQIGARLRSRRCRKLAPGRCNASPTRCRRTTISPASSIWRCRTRRSFTPSAIRSTPASPASRSCSRAEQNHTYDLGELGRYYRRYERLMAHWHRVLPAGRILDVRYEDVVADLETPGAPHHRPLRPAVGRRLPARSTRPTGRCAPPARRKCASRSTTARSAAGASTNSISDRCSMPWARADGAFQQTRTGSALRRHSAPGRRSRFKSALITTRNSPTATALSIRR